MRGRFEAEIDFKVWKALRAPKGYLLLRVTPETRDSVKEMIATYEKDCVRRVEAGEAPRPMALEWDIAYGKRSLGKNRLQWALLTLTCDLMNEGMPDGLDKLTPMRLYNQDMGSVAPCKPIVIEAKDLPWVSEAGVHVKAAIPIEGEPSLVQAYVVKTTSQMDDQEHHRYLEHLFNRLAMMGIPQSREPRLKGWWLTWMADIDEHRIQLHAEELSKDAYRELHPMCEGCGDFIGLEGGHVHHIRSKGAGGAEPERDKGSNWLHLCARKCHPLWTAVGGGVGAFKKVAPHLVNKIDAALVA